MTELKMDVNVKAILEAEREVHKKEVEKLNKKIKNLRSALKYEHERREYAESLLKEHESDPVKKRKRRTKAEVEAERAAKRTEYSEFKSNGVRKKTKMDPIKSYTDFRKIQEYLLKKNELVYYAVWTLGVSLGLRASDIVTLKWKNVLNDDMTFKERVKLYEQKTSKLQDCLITESVIDTLTKLLNDKTWNVLMDDYIFPGVDSNKPLTRDACYKHLRRAAEAVGIEYNIGTHTMRASFANIVLCVDNNTIDMNAITKIQGLLNHSDPRVTMKYLGKMDEMFDKARMVVSDFVMGKTDVDELVCGDQINLSSLMEKLDDIQKQLKS